MKVYVLIILGSYLGLFSQICDYKDPVFSKKNFKFKLHKRIPFVLDTSVIKFDGVYLGQKKLSDTLTVYSFFRFFKDGTYITSYTYCHFPTLEERINVSFGFKGQFVIETGSKIVLEFFDPYFRYFFKRGIVDFVSLKIISYQQRRANQDNAKIINYIGNEDYVYVQD